MSPAVKRAIEALKQAHKIISVIAAHEGGDINDTIAEALAGLEGEAALCDANAAIARQAAPEGLAEEVAAACAARRVINDHA